MIRNVVFDVGGVLLRLRYQPFIEYLGGAGVDQQGAGVAVQYRIGCSAAQHLLLLSALSLRLASRPATALAVRSTRNGSTPQEFPCKCNRKKASPNRIWWAR